MFHLSGVSRILVRQAHEIGEWIGFETRNKYRFTEESGREIAFAAEQQKGLFGFLFRQFLGHFRSFEIALFAPDRRQVGRAKHPFRWYFKRLELYNAEGNFLGAVEKRFAIFSKQFHVEDALGSVLLTVSSPIWRIWTFEFQRNGAVVAAIRKKWSGLLAEAFTDKDNFMVEFLDENLSELERDLILISTLYVDLSYFEKKAE